MNEKSGVFLRMQAGKTAVICELADELLFSGALSINQLDEIERRAIFRIKNAEFADCIRDAEQIAIIESGIDIIQTDFRFLRDRLRSVVSLGGLKPRGVSRT